jgi:hypothetical protein
MRQAEAAAEIKWKHRNNKKTTGVMIGKTASLRIKHTTSVDNMRTTKDLQKLSCGYQCGQFAHWANEYRSRR